jgi:hypothetical protein
VELFLLLIGGSGGWFLDNIEHGSSYSAYNNVELFLLLISGSGGWFFSKYCHLRFPLLSNRYTFQSSDFKAYIVE